MISNLKSINLHVTYHHFKMDNTWSAIRLMKPGCYVASIDLKGADDSVPTSKDHQKFLKFERKGAYLCVPKLSLIMMQCGCFTK